MFPRGGAGESLQSFSEFMLSIAVQFFLCACFKDETEDKSALDDREVGLEPLRRSGNGVACDSVGFVKCVSGDLLFRDRSHRFPVAPRASQSRSGIGEYWACSRLVSHSAVVLAQSALLWEPIAMRELHSCPTVPRQPVRLPPVFREFVSRLCWWNERLLAMDFSSK